MQFRKLYGGIPNGVCFKAEFVGLSTGKPTWKKFQFESPRLSKRTAWYQNWEILWYLETSANKAKTKSLTRMPTAEKAMKETVHNVAKKERTDHKCLWQETKTKPQMLVVNEKWLPLSGKQTADTKWKKQNSWNHLKTPNGCLPASIRWKNTHTHKKNPPNHNSLIDYCLQQRSGRLQSWEHRAKIIGPTTNRWKAKLTITNSKLTPH